MAGSEREAALDFAAKIAAAAKRKEATEAAEEAELEARVAKIGGALDRLFDDLEAMGTAAGVLEVTRAGRSIVLAYDGRRIRVASVPRADAPDHLEVEATGVDVPVSGYYGDEVDRWALKIDYPQEQRRRAYTQVYALLGMGMGWLVEHGLGLKLD